MAGSSPLEQKRQKYSTGLRQQTRARYGAFLYKKTSLHCGLFNGAVQSIAQVVAVDHTTISV